MKLRMITLVTCMAACAAANAQDGDCAVTLFAGSVYGQSQHSTDTHITGAFSIDGNGAGIGYGCRWRNGPWVGGLEADYMKTSTKGTATDVFGAESTTEVENTGTLRLTGGFMLRPKLLIYLTGGFSTASVKATVCPTPTSCGSDAHRLYGGVFGGGFEYLFTSQFSARLEALWFGLDNKSYFSPPPAGVISRTGGVSPDIQAIRAGLSWHF
jgi:outer membrane immunogenic protein